MGRSPSGRSAATPASSSSAGSLDTDRLEASYHDGVLTLSIPVAEKARARKIQVTRADAPAAVEHRTIEGESVSRSRRPSSS